MFSYVKADDHSKIALCQVNLHIKYAQSYITDLHIVWATQRPSCLPKVSHVIFSRKDECYSLTKANSGAANIILNTLMERPLIKYPVKYSELTCVHNYDHPVVDTTVTVVCTVV